MQSEDNSTSGQNVVAFPQRGHVRASAGSRAASLANVSAVTPADLAGSVCETANHHSPGIRSLCDHFRIAGTPAPRSDAIASCDGQSRITSRNEAGSCMPNVLGQSVLKSKPNVSHDGVDLMGHSVPMKDQAKTAYKTAFMARVTAARKLRFTQQAMAESLGMEQDSYKQYETRSLMPHHLIPRFCTICGVSTDWLITGKGAGPAVQPVLEAKPRAPKRPARRTRVA
jgi:hypothetical protein